MGVYLVNESAQTAIVIGGVMFLAWCGLGRWTQAGRIRPESVPDPQAAERAQVALLAEFRMGDVVPGGDSVCCTSCGTPYPAGVLYCECGGITEEDDDPDPNEWAERLAGLAPVPAAELVCIGRVDNFWKASLLRSYLENQGVPCAVQQGSGGPTIELVPLNRLGTFSLFVRQDDQHIARSLLAGLDSQRRT
jgi:hypothetical protein